MAADLARHSTVRSGRADVRGRPRVELRVLRLSGAAPGVRRQRLRRDPARAVRVRRQATGRQPGGRRPGERPVPQARRSHRGRGRRPLPEGDGGVRRGARHRGLVLARRRRRAAAAARPAARRRTAQAARSARSTRPGRRDTLQAFGKLTEVVDGRLRHPGRAPAASCRCAICSRRPSGTDLTGRFRDADRRVPSVAAGRPPHAARALHLRRHGPEGRRCRQRRHPLLDRPAHRPGRERPAAAADQGGAAVGARRVRRPEPIPEPGSARGGRPAPHAAGERHLPRLAAHGRASTGSSETSTSASSGTGRGRWRSRSCGPRG